jgi:hypothetical protein
MRPDLLWTNSEKSLSRGEVIAGVSAHTSAALTSNGVCSG